MFYNCLTCFRSAYEGHISLVTFDVNKNKRLTTVLRILQRRLIFSDRTKVQRNIKTDN